MKNCGHRFHVQVANRDFIDGVLVKIISPKTNPPTIVQDKVLSLIQVFSVYILVMIVVIQCCNIRLSVWGTTCFCHSLAVCQWCGPSNLASQVGTVCSTSQVLYHRLQPLVLSVYLRSPQPTGGVLPLCSRCPLIIYRDLVKAVSDPRDTPLLDTVFLSFARSIYTIREWMSGRM